MSKEAQLRTLEEVLKLDKELLSKLEANRKAIMESMANTLNDIKRLEARIKEIQQHSKGGKDER